MGINTSGGSQRYQKTRHFSAANKLTSTREVSRIDKTDKTGVTFEMPVCMVEWEVRILTPQGPLEIPLATSH